MNLIVSFFDTLAELARKSTAEKHTKIASIQEQKLHQFKRQIIVMSKLFMRN